MFSVRRPTGTLVFKLLRDRDEVHAMLLEHSHHAGKVEERTAEPVDFIDHHAVDPASLDSRHQVAHRGPFHVAARKSAIVVPVRHSEPALLPLAQDERFGCFALRMKGVELLFQSFRARFPSVDGAPY
jgi:hypothetical protein